MTARESLLEARSQVVRDLASAFVEGSDSDSWSQGDVYRKVLSPLAAEVVRYERLLDEVAQFAAEDRWTVGERLRAIREAVARG